MFLTDNLRFLTRMAALINLNMKEYTMKANVGGMDRILRIVAGLVLIGLTLTDVIGIWGWIGVVPLVTGLFKFCPFYTLLGMNTCPMEARK